MEQPDPQEAVPEAAADGGHAASEPESPRLSVTPPSRRGVVRRIVGAVVMLPWILGYGSVGAWAVTFGARAVAAGETSVDAGYTRMVAPSGVIFVGALLLAAFATLLAAALLLLHGSRRWPAWTAVAGVAGALTAGAVWAGVRGELSPVLWVFFFFGLVDALLVALFQAYRGARSGRRDEVLKP
jgi:hypothetical protein